MSVAKHARAGDLAVGLEAAPARSFVSADRPGHSGCSDGGVPYVGLHRQPRCCPALDHLDAGLRQSPKAAASRHHGDGRPHGKALRDINAEWGLNDFPDAVVGEDGVGGGVLDRLRELGLPVAGLKGGTAPIDKERFVDKRAEWFWSPREAVRERRGRHRPRRRRPRRAALGDQVEVDVAGPDRDRVDGRDTQARSPLPRPRRRPGPTPSPSWTCLQSTSSRTRARASPGI